MIEQSRLENGLTILTETVPAARSVSLGVLIDCSPQDDPADRLGLAHLLEHALFCGTHSRSASQLASLLDVVGGQIGGLTTRDYTCFQAVILDDYFTFALELLGDILLNATFPEPQVEHERQAIISEIGMLADQPAHALNQLLKQQVWGDHPLGRAVTGRSDQLMQCDQADLLQMREDRYCPARMIVAAAGAISHEAFLSQARDAFWRLQGTGTEIVRHGPVARKQLRIAPAATNQAYFAFGIPLSRYASDDRYAICLLNEILGGGLSSRLNTALRGQSGLAYEIGSEWHAYRQAGLLVQQGSTTPEQLGVTIQRVFQELASLTLGEQPVTEEELWAAQLRLHSAHLLSGESTHGLMSRLLTQQFYCGAPIASEEILRRLQAVELSDIERVLQQMRHGLGYLNLTILTPSATSDATTSLIQSLFDDYTLAFSLSAEAALPRVEQTPDHSLTQEWERLFGHAAGAPSAASADGRLTSCP